MAEKENFSWTNVIVLAAFCILGSLGGGFTVRSMLGQHSPVTLLVYGVAGGVFIALSVVVILQLLDPANEA